MAGTDYREWGLAATMWSAREDTMRRLFTDYEPRRFDLIDPAERAIWMAMSRAAMAFEPPTIRTHIAQIREWLDDGHTSAELARGAGISQKHVSQVLLGKAYMRPATILDVATVIGADPYELAYGQAMWQIDWACRDLLRDNA